MRLQEHGVLEGQGVGSDGGAVLGILYLKENPGKSLQIQSHADITPKKELWSCQVCVGKDTESMHGQEEQDSGICHKCFGLRQLWQPGGVM